MRRPVSLVVSGLLLLLVAAPVAAADGSLPHSGHVLIATEGDVTVPAGDHADFVLVTRGTATIEGEVNTILVVDGTAVLDGARTETVIAIRTPVTLGDGTVVTGEIHKLDSEVTRIGDARVVGGVRDIAADAAGLGLILGPAVLLLFVGLTLVAVVAALALAGLAARQVRTAERAISREPVTVLVAGLGGIVFLTLLVVALFATIVGAPLALALMIAVLPAAAFIGYLIAGIWIGDWLLARVAPARERQRPYMAAVIGVLLLQVLAIWPFFGGIAGLFGFGALLLVAWRTFRGTGAPVPSMPAAGSPVLQGG